MNRLTAILKLPFVFIAWLMKPSNEKRLKVWREEVASIQRELAPLRGDIEYWESREQRTLEAGAEAAKAKNTARQKSLASDLTETRRNLKRLRAQHQIRQNKITSLNTLIHNLNLAEEGKKSKLNISTDEMASIAAQAEQTMAELTAAADMATSIEVGPMETSFDAETEEIFEEFAAMSGAEQPEPEQAEETAEYNEKTETTEETPTKTKEHS